MAPLRDPLDKTNPIQEHEDWLRTQVAAGRYATLEDAVAEAIEGLKDESDELAWAKPLVAEGLAELDRGEAVPAEEVSSRESKRGCAKSCERWRGFGSRQRPRVMLRRLQRTSRLLQGSAWPRICREAAPLAERSHGFSTHGAAANGVRAWRKILGHDALRHLLSRERHRIEIIRIVHGRRRLTHALLRGG